MRNIQFLRFIRMSVFIIVITLVVIIGITALPWILIGLGTAMEYVPTPEVKSGEFPFKIVYEIEGQRMTIEDTLVIKYHGKGMDEGQGKYNKWDISFLRDSSLNYSSRIKGVPTSHWITLYREDSTKVSIDIGQPEYYFNLLSDETYKPGTINTNATNNTSLSYEELSEQFKIKIIEATFSDPLK